MGKSGRICYSIFVCRAGGELNNERMCRDRACAAMRMCRDRGPWLCFEHGCPALVVDCQMIADQCDLAFSDIWEAGWSVPQQHAIWQHCEATCGMCSQQCTPPTFDNFVRSDPRPSTLALEQPGVAVWRSPTVAVTALAGGMMYEVRPGRRALVLQGAEWAPMKCDNDHWTGASSSFTHYSHPALRKDGLAKSSAQCTLSWQNSQRMLDTFLQEHGAALDTAYGVRECSLQRQAYMLEMSRAWSKGKVHFDICDPVEDALQIGIRLAPGAIGWQALSVLAYPNREWKPEWGGTTDFIAGDCAAWQQDHRTINASNYAPRVLRVGPLPHRTLVFSADMLHAYGYPSLVASHINRTEHQLFCPVQSSPPRRSIVVRLLCHKFEHVGL